MGKVDRYCRRRLRSLPTGTTFSPREISRFVDRVDSSRQVRGNAFWAIFFNHLIQQLILFKIKLVFETDTYKIRVKNSSNLSRRFTVGSYLLQQKLIKSNLILSQAMEISFQSVLNFNAHCHVLYVLREQAWRIKIVNLIEYIQYGTTSTREKWYNYQNKHTFYLTYFTAFF